MESFLNNPATATSAEEASHFAKICKGATLMEKAFRLVSSLKPGNVTRNVPGVLLIPNDRDEGRSPCNLQSGTSEAN